MIDETDMLNEGQIIYDTIQQLIEMYPTNGAEYLKGMLDREIRRYSKTSVLKAMSQVPDDVINSLQDVIYYEDDSKNISRAIREFAEAITGVIPDEEKMKELGNLMDRL